MVQQECEMSYCWHIIIMYALSILLFAFQMVCISEATRFLVLKAGQSHAHVHLKLSLTIETWKDENRETFFPSKTDFS